MFMQKDLKKALAFTMPLCMDDDEFDSTDFSSFDLDEDESESTLEKNETHNNANKYPQKQINDANEVVENYLLSSIGEFENENEFIFCSDEGTTNSQKSISFTKNIQNNQSESSLDVKRKKFGSYNILSPQKNQNVSADNFLLADNKNLIIEENYSDKKNALFFYGGFKTGNDKNIFITSSQVQRAPNPPFKHKSDPIRMYNCPDQGHVSSEAYEKVKYFDIYSKVKKEFFKVDQKLLKIQYRWAWMHLYFNNKLHMQNETLKLIIQNINVRILKEYSILRRIIEGDETSHKYMIVLVLSFYNDILEIYDGYFSCKIQIDTSICNFLRSKQVKGGFKIKLFGCKKLFRETKGMLEYDEENILMQAFYNAFEVALPNRTLGYRKKKSFLKNICNIKKEGGVVSCIKGIVTKIIERKYMVKVKGYRNSVENLDEEINKIQSALEKTAEIVTKDDVKISTFIKFVLKDISGECVVTSWIYTEEIVENAKIACFGLQPVTSSIGIELKTTKHSFIKFYEK